MATEIATLYQVIALVEDLHYQFVSWWSAGGTKQTSFVMGMLMRNVQKRSQNALNAQPHITSVLAILRASIPFLRLLMLAQAGLFKSAKHPSGGSPSSEWRARTS